MRSLARPLDRAGKPSRQVPAPLWGGPKVPLGTHKHRTLPQGSWTPYMQTMLNMQFGGPLWGPSAPPSLGDGPPAIAGLRLLGHAPHPCSLAYHLLLTQHGACFSLASPTHWQVSPPRGSFFLLDVHSPPWPSRHLTAQVSVFASKSPTDIAPMVTQSFPQHAESLSRAQTHTVSHTPGDVCTQPVSLP